MRRFSFAIVATLAAVSAALAQPMPKLAPPWDQPDSFGRKIPWGDEIKGQRLSLQLPVTRMLYGQPLELRLVSAQANQRPPYLRVSWEEPRRTASVEWTTDRGEAVPFTLRHGGGGSSVGGNRNEFRLIPTGKFARGLHVAPGSYRLRVVIEAKPNSVDGNAWIGRLVSNTLEFTVVESTPAGRRKLVPEALRERAESAAKDLGDREKRPAAEETLAIIGLDILPLADDWLLDSNPEKQAAGKFVLAKLPEFGIVGDESVAGLVLGQLTNAGWDALAEKWPAERLERLRVRAAEYGPAPFELERDPLPAKTVTRLVAELRDPTPHVRMAAVRAMPQTANEELLKALVERLTDNYSVYPRPAPGDPVPIQPIALHVRFHAIPGQGKAAIGPLLELLKSEPTNVYVRFHGIPLLGELGADPRSIALFGEQLNTGSHNDQISALTVLGTFGKDAAGRLFAVARDDSRTSATGIIQRRIAIEQLANCGNATEHGPFLREMLQSKDAQLVGAAVQAIDRLKVREAVPDLMKLAREERDVRERTWVSVQHWAIAAVGRLADRKTAEEFLTAMLTSKSHGSRGNAALALAALGCREAVPKLLDLLADTEWYVRAVTDNALKALAQKPEGVGYDPAKPEPEKWRAYWKERK